MFQKTYKALDVTVGPQGIVEGIAAVTGNIDLGNDIIVPGAFQKFLGQVKAGELPQPPVIWGHDASRPENVLGNIIEMEEYLPGDYRLPAKLLRAGFGGLYVKVQYDFDTPNGETVFNHVKSGRIVQWSFAFDAPDRSFDEKGHRLLKTISPVYEVSNVLVGMNPATSVMSVKTARRRSSTTPDWMLAAFGLALANARAEDRPPVLSPALRSAVRSAVKDASARQIPDREMIKRLAELLVAGERKGRGR